jgi:anhydro-N-acetylmuramic acid kinase
MNQSFRVIGLMSGSSLDGLDIAYCEFNFSESNWSFEMLKTEVIPFASEWIKDLQQLPSANAKALWERHTSLGHYFGEQVKHFIAHHNLGGQVDLVSSHGHTIFHFPDKQFTTQIADGAAIAAACGLPVVCDFRSADIAPWRTRNTHRANWRPSFVSGISFLPECGWHCEYFMQNGKIGSCI